MRKTKVSLPLIIMSFFLIEILLSFITEITYTNTSNPMIVLRMSVSVLSTFILLLLFEISMLQRIFIALGFQALYMLSEICSEYIITHTFHVMNEDIFIHISDVIQFMTYTVLFLFITIISIFQKRHLSLEYGRYSPILLVTPIITIILTFNENIYMLSITNPETYILLIVSLLIINYSYYIILEISISTTKKQEYYKHISQQNEFQKNKYNQLSSSYKKLRSYHHDTKKRFLYIEECIKEKKYDLIIPYLNESLRNLDSSYSKINTGNLVIDSFINNYLVTSEENNIQFIPDLQVNYSLIPISDYDLSIILGNLLDNALNACLKIKPPLDRFIKVCIRTETEHEQFILHISNSNIQNKSDEFMNELIHGYGLKNAKDYVEKNQGIISIKDCDNIYEVTVILPYSTLISRRTEESSYS